MHSMLRNIWERTHHGYLHMLAASVVITGLLGGTAIFEPALAQDNGSTDTTFTVTRVVKTSEHPYYDEGDDDGYAIDGEEGKEVILERGQTYYFIMDEVETFHPFYIATDSIGEGASRDNFYTDGVSSTWDENDRAAESDTLIFTPGENAPDELWYGCTNHQLMGYRVTIVDPTSTGIDEEVAGRQLPSSFAIRGNYPNPFNPTTNVRFDLPRAADVHIEIYTSLGTLVKRVAGGRMSAGARSIQIDGADLSSGMYLYRVIATAGRSSYMGVGKMVLTK